jgi:single-strand DNA-binding protein
MSNVRNSVRLIGNLGSDPEVKEVGKTTLAKLVLATSESYKNEDGEKVQETQWHNLVIWGKSAAAAAQFLKKGAEIAVEGKLSTRSYEDKEGKRKYVTEVVVRNYTFIGKKPG